MLPPGTLSTPNSPPAFILLSCSTHDEPYKTLVSSESIPAMYSLASKLHRAMLSKGGPGTLATEAQARWPRPLVPAFPAQAQVTTTNTGTKTERKTIKCLKNTKLKTDTCLALDNFIL